MKIEILKLIAFIKKWRDFENCENLPYLFGFLKTIFTNDFIQKYIISIFLLL